MQGEVFGMFLPFGTHLSSTEWCCSLDFVTTSPVFLFYSCNYSSVLSLSLCLSVSLSLCLCLCVCLCVCLSLSLSLALCV